MTSEFQKELPLQYTLENKAPSEVRVAICYSEWNQKITHSLRDAAIQTLEKSGINREQIIVFSVPGAFELNYAAASCLSKGDFFDGIIVLGCVIRGETSHYDCICNGVTEGITELNLKAEKPVIFGLVTTENMTQAEERANGKLGNKGSEVAITLLKMIDFSCKLENLFLSLHSERKKGSSFIG